jgi:hypothetical protein
MMHAFQFSGLQIGMKHFMLASEISTKGCAKLQQDIPVALSCAAMTVEF